MGVKLFKELVDGTPLYCPDITHAEWRLLGVLAEACRDETRRGYGHAVEREEILRKTGLEDKGLQAAYQRLAARNLDPRIPIGKDKTGRPVYAVRGHQTEFLFPDLAAAVDLDKSPRKPRKAAPPGQQGDPGTAAQEDRSCRDRTLDGPVTTGPIAEKGPVVTGNGPVTTGYGPVATGPIPSYPLSSPQARACARAQPQAIIAESLADQTPTSDEVEAVFGLVVAGRTVTHPVPYCRKIADDGGFSEYLDQVRAAATAAADAAFAAQLAATRHNGPYCPHGEVDLATSDGQPYCSTCRQHPPVNLADLVAAASKEMP